MRKVEYDGRIGIKHDAGDDKEFDAYVERLCRLGLSKKYLYETLVEEENLSIDYNAYDQSRIESLGIPADYLRRCGIYPKHMNLIRNDEILAICNTTRQIDELSDRTTVVWDRDKRGESERESGLTEKNDRKFSLLQ